MARRGDKKPRPVIGDPSDPRGMSALMSAFLEALRVGGYSPATISGREAYLRQFALWCEERAIHRAADITRPVLERYQRQVFERRKKNGQPLSYFGQVAPLSVLRAFFRWLARKNLILYNPASELELPRPEKHLPMHILSASETELVLSQPDVTDPLGLRDRAILETLYSTGLRRIELCGLTVEDLNPEAGTLFVRQGKGNRDRIVPIGERALAWVRKYIHDVRSALVRDAGDRTLFLTRDGLKMIPNSLTNLVRRHVRSSGLKNAGSCHMFRHTMATLMHDGGADIRYIQQMLGHEALSSTQIYTQVAIRRLKQIHDATHPAARLERPQHRPEDG